MAKGDGPSYCDAVATNEGAVNTTGQQTEPAAADPPEAPGPARRRPPAPGTAVLCTVAIAVGGWIIQLGPLIDNSFLWHLKTGHWILDHGFPRHDPFSFTAPGEPWVLQSWLAEVIYAGTDRLAGPEGIRLLRGLLGMAIAVLAYRLALRLSRHTARAAFIAAASVAASMPFWSSRPLVFGILALLLLVWVVEVPDSGFGSRPMPTIPIIMWLWANLHGTFALGFVYLALHLGGRWLDGHPPNAGRERRLGTAALVGFALCFANPYGAPLVTFPVRLLSRGDVLRQVVEWSSPDFRSVFGILFGIWLAALLAVLLPARRRLTRRDTLIVVVFVLLALWAQRNIALAAFTGMPVLARHSAAAELRDRARVLNYALIAALVALGAKATTTLLAKPDFDLAPHYPVPAMRAVENRGLLGRRLATTDYWGAYLIHAYWPRQRVFLDDRYDMYPSAMFDDYYELLVAKPTWQGVLDRWRIDVVVWPTDTALTQLLTVSPGWSRVYRDQQATVFARR